MVTSMATWSEMIVMMRRPADVCHLTVFVVVLIIKAAI